MKEIIKPTTILLLLGIWILISGCGKTGINQSSLPEQPETFNSTIFLTPTPVSFSSSPTPSPILSTAVQTFEPPPAGTFRLLIFYEPLTLKYDVSQWEDKTQYNQPVELLNNYLQSRIWSTCTIGIQGPTEFNDPSIFQSEQVSLGDISYETMLFTDDSEGTITIFYIDLESVDSFDYSNWLPVLVLHSNVNEWEACKQLGEIVLSTLRMP